MKLSRILRKLRRNNQATSTTRISRAPGTRFLTDDINIWIETQAFVESVSDADIDWAEETFKPMADGEKLIGVIDNLLTRQVFAGAYRLWAMSHAETAKAALEHDPIQKHELEVRAHRLDAMGDILKEIAFSQMCDDVNAWGPKYAARGIRSGWKMVGTTERPNPLAAMFGGSR
jgi:hypothetical protein